MPDFVKGVPATNESHPGHPELLWSVHGSSSGLCSPPILGIHYVTVLSPPPPLLFLWSYTHVEISLAQETSSFLPSPPNAMFVAQYTPLNFVFKNLWAQFHRPANVYFLGISILQCIEAISITGGTPTTLVPLTVVLVVRHTRSDRHSESNPPDSALRESSYLT